MKIVTSFFYAEEVLECHWESYLCGYSIVSVVLILNSRQIMFQYTHSGIINKQYIYIYTYNNIIGLLYKNDDFIMLCKTFIYLYK